MNTPSTVTNASARLTMESVNRLIEMEVNAATAKLRGENEGLRQAVRDLENRLLTGRNRTTARLHRDGQMMVVIAVGCSLVCLIAGFAAAEVLMR
jgi:hypothetical protein